MAWIPRYYYNTRTHTCKRFIYGGCQGNANNFETIAECKSSCMGKKPICIIYKGKPEDQIILVILVIHLLTSHGAYCYNFYYHLKIYYH